MKISVIIPVYNRRQKLNDALLSLQNQSLKDFEIIIVDDGSDESLEDVLIDFNKNLQIKYIKLEHTGNIAYVRNKGFEQAVGKYIAVLDSDDLSLPLRFEKQYEYLERNPDTDILASWTDFIADDKNSSSDKLNLL